MFGGSTSLVQWKSESKNLRKDQRVGIIARWIIMLLCFPYGMDLTGSIPVLHFQGLSLYLFGLYFDDEYPHKKFCAGRGAQERVMVVGRVCCEGERHPIEIVALREGEYVDNFLFLFSRLWFQLCVWITLT